jgi:hypothetical protein
VSEDPSRAAWLRQARSHLRHADPVLARLIDDRPDFDPRAWLECGHVGCCDNSPGRPATARFRLAGHPVVRWYEPGEDW